MELIPQGDLCSDGHIYRHGLAPQVVTHHKGIGTLFVLLLDSHFHHIKRIERIYLTSKHNIQIDIPLERKRCDPNLLDIEFPRLCPKFHTPCDSVPVALCLVCDAM